MAHNTDRNAGVDVDTLYVGATRPTTIAGATWEAVTVNIMVTMNFFLFSRNLLWLLIFVPIHGICYLICLRDPRTFELIGLWGKAKAQAIRSNIFHWHIETYSPLEIHAGKKPSFASKRRFKELSK